MHRKTHVGFGEEGTCFLPEAIQERRCALTLPVTARHELIAVAGHVIVPLASGPKRTANYVSWH